MAAKTTTTTSSNVKAALNITVIIAVITSQFLSVDAISCHQCNSHLTEDCTDLRLNTPRAQRDNQYLKECKVEANAPVFCRKVVLHMEVTGEKRVIRECGWLTSRTLNSSEPMCHTAEHVGYKQTICVCEESGCNGSATLHLTKWAAMGASALALVAAAVLRWN